MARPPIPAGTRADGLGTVRALAVGGSVALTPGVLLHLQRAVGNAGVGLLLTYWYWKPTHTDDRTVVVVGMPRTEVERYFASVELAATITTPDGVENDQSGEEILVARQPRVPLDQAWPQLRTLA